MTTLVYTTPPTVGSFMESDAFVRVIVGPVGSGKSSGCIMELPRRASEQAPNAQGIRKTRWAVIRNTYRELEDTTRKTFEQWIPEGLGEWREKDFAFDIEQPMADGTVMQSEILFRALDKPRDVKKLLSLEITGAYINELREVPKIIFDGVQMRLGRYPSIVDGGPTWHGLWADSNPWSQSSDYYKLLNENRPPEFDLFEQPDALGPEAENVENLPAGYYTRMCAGKDSAWVDEYVRAKYPRADKGSIYGEWLSRIALSDFEHPSDGVFANFDLGVSDSTAIWWWRLGRDGVPDILDWYECNGEGASHYFSVLKSRGYRYSKILLPHDARARTFQTGVSTLEQFVKEFGSGMVGLTPELSIADGIGAGRKLLELPIRIHKRCEGGVERLKAYRYQWDPNRLTFSKAPLHDWTSHTADAWRYVACQANPAAIAQRALEAATPKAKAVSTRAPTLSEWMSADDGPRSERI